MLLGNGDGTFQAPQAYGFGDGPLAVAAGDFNRDGAPDLAVGHGDSITVLLGNGDGTFRMGPTFGVGNRPTSMGVGDFNGDGLADLAVASWDSVSVLRGNGDGTFQAALTFGAGRGPTSVAVGDFNNDGKLDLAVANLASNDVSVLINNTPATPPTILAITSPSSGATSGTVTVRASDDVGVAASSSSSTGRPRR